ncbi:MAG TPA: hypothetical protein VK616_20620, partial [Flavitalea sp.]|nr:hypothetical protein [Flavitalea sp.]
ENTLKGKITPGDDFIPATMKRYPWLKGVILLTTEFLENTLKKKIVPADDFISATMKNYPWLKGVIVKQEVIS